MAGDGKPGVGPNTPRCGAKKRRKGENGEDLFCGRVAGWGTDHNGFGNCKFHGGSTPSQKKAADRWKTDKDARRELERLDVVITPVTDPLTELSRLTGEAVAWKNLMDEKIQGLAEEEWRFTDEKGQEQLRSEIALWERALDRCERFLTAMAKLNIDERLARIDEQQAEIIIKAVQATLRDLGMTLEEQENARKQLARQLRFAPAMTG